MNEVEVESNLRKLGHYFFYVLPFRLGQIVKNLD